ncbi:DUF6544 family protein [Maribacter halichondriae]|uniref:DUF6544 family protein n=1 Tax=Maribacter halichondriae TaxID=2980554 RepID=UPI0023591D4F|nr:DUF6544 family protein [Maribacter sp. Hal144]
MRIVLTLFLFFHGLLHFLGFVRAFAIGSMAEFTKEFSKPVGLLWLLTGLLFVLSALMILFRKEGWHWFVFMAAIVSQFLILTVWADAKYGTIANVMLLIVAIVGLGTERFENGYKKDVVSAMESATLFDERITENDLSHLPFPVQNNLRYVGVLGKPRVYNFKIRFEGAMRDKGKDWFQFTSEQYNFIASPARLFFMKAKVKGLPTAGYHAYKRRHVGMLIKLLSLFPVVNIDSQELFATETVTFFNDLCLFAPAALIDDRIVWEAIDDISAKATFTTNGTSISAILHFNQKGQLVNFVSEDRISVSEMTTFPFSTPIKNYKNVNGYKLPTYGEAIWHYPDGEFIYGRFNLKSVEYNVTELQ